MHDGGWKLIPTIRQRQTQIGILRMCFVVRAYMCAHLPEKSAENGARAPEKVLCTSTERIEISDDSRKFSGIVREVMFRAQFSAGAPLTSPNNRFDRH